MAIEKVPAKKAPWPPTGDGQGGNVNPYPLGGNARESFYTIADDLTRKGRPIKPIDLVKLNFGTTDLAEVNWYLKNYVGCTQTTSDGKNYSFGGLKFSPANPTRAVIFVPRPKITLDPIDLTKPITAPEQAAVQNGWEFELGGPPRPFKIGAITGTITLSGKGKATLLESSGEVGIGFTKEELGLAITKKLTDDISFQAGGKFKLDDLKKPNKNLIKNLRESLEATVSGTGFRSADGASSISFEGGLKASATPFLFKVSGTWEGKRDIGPYLPDALNTKSFPIVFSVTPQITIEFGLSPEVMRMMGPAAIVAGLFIGFIALGAWSGGNAARRGELKGMLSWYVAGYVHECALSDMAPLPVSIDERQLVDAGRKDAQDDMRKNFPNHSSRDQRLLTAALWIMAGGGTFGTRDGAVAGRKALSDHLYATAMQRAGLR